jgi:hypothetical protein
MEYFFTGWLAFECWAMSCFECLNMTGENIGVFMCFAQGDTGSSLRCWLGFMFVPLDRYDCVDSKFKIQNSRFKIEVHDLRVSYAAPGGILRSFYPCDKVLRNDVFNVNL